jgi:hypothetical protein
MLLTMLQQRTAAPQANVGDFTAIINAFIAPAFNFLNVVINPIIHILYLAVLFVILYRIWKQKGFAKMSMMEIIALAIALGLMRS